MAFIPVPNTVKCDVIGQIFGQIISNTLYFSPGEEVLPSVVIELAGAVADWATTRLCAVLSEDYSFLRVEATDITEEGLASFTSVDGAGTPGSDPDPAAPAGTCVAVSFRTGLGGRSYRGRNYVSGISKVSCIGNQCATTKADDIVAQYALLNDDIQAVLPLMQHVVASRYHLNAPRVTGIVTPVLTYLVTNYDIDSQRRRLTGRGT